MFRQIAEQRRKHILGFAEPHLLPGEHIVQWARVKQREPKRDGFIFLSDRRCLVVWRNKPEEPVAIEWEQVLAWGLDKGARRGPILCIETPDETVFLQMQAGSKALALGAGALVRRFAALAPSSSAPRRDVGFVNFHPDREARIVKDRLSPAELTRRVVVTVVGVALIVVGITIIPLPGPWSFVVNLAGLALLATEYDWAQDLLDWGRQKYKVTVERIKARRRRPD